MSDHLNLFQVFALDLISSYPENDINGVVLRAALKKNGYNKSVPGFCDAMGRLERAGLVSGRHATTKKDGRTIRQKFYATTKEGEEALAESRDRLTRRKWSPLGEAL